jgi:hypothetical protein
MGTCKEIEVTEEMMEADYRLLLDSGITDAQVEADKLGSKPNKACSSTFAFGPIPERRPRPAVAFGDA